MKLKTSSNNLFITNSMKLFFMLCLYFLSVLVLFSITEILNINNVLGLIEIISIIIPIMYIYKNTKIDKKLYTIISIFLLLVVVLPFLSTKTFDTTVDGNTYHKSSIAFIKNGWNPVYQGAKEFQKENSDVIKIEDDSILDVWMDHYPKATWIVAAVMYNLTGNIESGKCITIILSIMLLIITYNVLRKILDKKWAVIISLLFTLNPIVLGQFYSYYLDGIMGICFLMQLILLFHVNPMEKQNIMIWTSLAAIISIFSNLKFTGLMCSGVIAAIFYFYWIIKFHKEKDFFKKFRKITYYFIGVYVIAICLVGSNSYIKNTIDHHNPLYPLLGKGKIDIVTTMQPKEYGKMNSVEKFTYSLFSKTENTIYEMNKPDLKLPFQVYKSEIQELYSPDTRIGGFGPLFTLCLIISIIIFIPSIIILYKNEKNNVKYVVISLLSVVVTMIMVGEVWWARYVPQFYFVVVGTLFLLVYISKYINNKFINYIKYLFMVPILINIFFFLYVVLNTTLSFRTLNNDLIELKNTKNLKLEIGRELYGYEYLLKDRKINYKKVYNLKEDEVIYKFSWKFKVKRSSSK